MKFLVIVTTFFLTLSTIHSQISVKLFQPPPYGFKLERMWNVRLVNSSQNTYRIYLRGVAVETTEGFICDAKGSAFLLPPGIKNITATDIKPIIINETNAKYEDVVKKIGTVPSGNYEICVYVIEEETGNELASDCIQTEVINLSQITLLYPEDNSILNLYSREEVEDTSISNLRGIEKKDIRRGMVIAKPGSITPHSRLASRSIVFSWLPLYPVPHGSNVKYKIKITQIYGNQSSTDAIISNPAFYSDEITTTVYQYPISARALSDGQYAWQVQAYLNGVLLSESEVWKFSIGNSEVSRNQGFSDNINVYWENAKGIKGAGSQYKVSSIIFSLDSRIYGENANRSGTGSDKKPRYGYWELSPRLGLFGIPFTMPILLSSENSASRQNINSMSINFDSETIKELIANRVEKEKERIVDELGKDITRLSEKEKIKIENKAKEKVNSRLNPLLKFISYFRTFGVGTSYPDYTPLTVSGIPLTGVNVEFNPGLFYIAIGGFKNQKPIDNTAFRRDFFSGRIGIGQKDRSHFYLTALYAKDDVNSIKIDSLNTTLTPKANYLFGIEGKLNLFRQKLTLEGEIAGAMLTRDTRDADLENKSIPDWVKNLVHPKISSSVDYSYSVRGIFNDIKSGTKITAGVKMIGPGYTSLGVPNLAKDKLEVKSKIEKKFINNQISLSSELTWFRDNLIKWKKYTTQVTRLGFSASIRLKGIPTINLMFAPLFMKNDAVLTADKLDNKSYTGSLITGYSYRLKDMNMFSSLSYLLNSASDIESATSQNTSVHNLLFSQNVSFGFPLNLSTSFGISFGNYPSDYSRIASADFSMDYTLFDIQNAFIGFGTSYEKDKNKKNTFYIGTSLWYKEYINFEIRAEKTLYHSWINSSTNYDEFIFKGIITSRF